MTSSAPVDIGSANETTQIYRIFIKATPQAIWDAITKPEWTQRFGYGLGQGSGLIKIDLDTGQWGNVAPNFGSDRPNYVEGRDFWKRFDTAFEPGAMYVGYNCLMVTRDGGLTWKASSPDLTSPKGQPLQPCGAAPTPVATPMPKIGITNGITIRTRIGAKASSRVITPSTVLPSRRSRGAQVSWGSRR